MKSYLIFEFSHGGYYRKPGGFSHHAPSEFEVVSDPLKATRFEQGEVPMKTLRYFDGKLVRLKVEVID